MAYSARTVAGFKMLDLQPNIRRSSMVASSLLPPGDSSTPTSMSNVTSPRYRGYRWSLLATDREPVKGDGDRLKRGRNGAAFQGTDPVSLEYDKVDANTNKFNATYLQHVQQHNKTLSGVCSVKRDFWKMQKGRRV